jgi:hypothetical protein
MILFSLFVLFVRTGCDGEAWTPKFGFIVVRDITDAAMTADRPEIPLRDCPVREDIPTVTYRNPLGAHAELWTDPTSQFELSASPREILLTRHANADGSQVVAARARFFDADQKILRDYRARYATCRILVSMDDEPAWVATNRSDWTTEIPIGIFDLDSTAYEALVGGDWQIRWVEWPELEEASKATQASRIRALEMLACDDVFRDEFERENPGALELLGDALEGIDCD